MVWATKAVQHIHGMLTIQSYRKLPQLEQAMQQFTLVLFPQLKTVFGIDAYTNYSLISHGLQTISFSSFVWVREFVGSHKLLIKKFNQSYSSISTEQESGMVEP